MKFKLRVLLQAFWLYEEDHEHTWTHKGAWLHQAAKRLQRSKNNVK